MITFTLLFLSISIALVARLTWRHTRVARGMVWHPSIPAPGHDLPAPDAGAALRREGDRGTCPICGLEVWKTRIIRQETSYQRPTAQREWTLLYFMPRCIPERRKRTRGYWADQAPNTLPTQEAFDAVTR